MQHLQPAQHPSWESAHSLQYPQTATNQWGSYPVYGASDAQEFDDSPLESSSQFVAVSEAQVSLHGGFPASHASSAIDAAKIKALGWGQEIPAAHWQSRSPQRSRQPPLAEIHPPQGPRQVPVGPPGPPEWNHLPPLTVKPKLAPTHEQGRYAAQQTAQENQPNSPSAGGVRFLARPVAQTRSESLAASPQAAHVWPLPQGQRYPQSADESEGGHNMPYDQWGCPLEGQHLQKKQGKGSRPQTQARDQWSDPSLVARLLAAEEEAAQSRTQEEGARAELAALLQHSEVNLLLDDMYRLLRTVPSFASLCHAAQ